MLQFPTTTTDEPDAPPSSSTVGDNAVIFTRLNTFNTLTLVSFAGYQIILDFANMQISVTRDYKRSSNSDVAICRLRLSLLSLRPRHGSTATLQLSFSPTCSCSCASASFAFQRGLFGLVRLAARSPAGAELSSYLGNAEAESRRPARKSHLMYVGGYFRTPKRQTAASWAIQRSQARQEEQSSSSKGTHPHR